VEKGKENMGRLKKERSLQVLINIWGRNDMAPSKGKGRRDWKIRIWKNRRGGRIGESILGRGKKKGVLRRPLLLQREG